MSKLSNSLMIRKVRFLWILWLTKEPAGQHIPSHFGHRLTAWMKEEPLKIVYVDMCNANIHIHIKHKLLEKLYVNWNCLLVTQSKILKNNHVLLEDNLLPQSCNSFIQQTFIEHPLCARHPVRYFWKGSTIQHHKTCEAHIWKLRLKAAKFPAQVHSLIRSAVRI